MIMNIMAKMIYLLPWPKVAVVGRDHPRGVPPPPAEGRHMNDLITLEGLNHEGHREEEVMMGIPQDVNHDDEGGVNKKSLREVMDQGEGQAMIMPQGILLQDEARSMATMKMVPPGFLLVGRALIITM